MREIVVKEHNKELYLKMRLYLHQQRKACVILGTGLGKTTTALQFLFDENVRGLVIVPNNTVKKSWENVRCRNKCDCITYSYFMNHFMSISYHKYGLVILDEVHHIGADKWGEGVQWLLTRNFIPVLGLTATPTRTDMIDIRNYFGATVCEGLSIFEGIKQGILCPFSYIGAYYDAEGIVLQAKQRYAKIDTHLKGLLDIALNNTTSVKQIIQTNMPTGLRKGIVFVSRISELEEAKNLILSIYPEAQVKILHSKMNSNEIEQVTNWFYDIQEGYLITVCMMGEGAHFPNVNTLIMLRKTMSNVVFTQQLGRCLTLTEEARSGDAIVFDLVNNAINLKNFQNMYAKVLQERKCERKTTVYSNQVILKCYTKEIDEIIERIHSLHFQPKRHLEKIYCIETDCEYQNVYEASMALKLSVRQILRVLHQEIKSTGEIGYHFCFSCEKDSYQLPPLYKKGAGFHSPQSIICLNTQKIYPNLKAASRDTGVNGTAISRVCNKICNTAKGLTFLYLKDWDGSQQPNKVRIKNKICPKKVRCVETGQIFNTLTEAGKSVGLGYTSISAACTKIRGNGKQATAGGYHWEFVEDKT